MTIKPNFSIIHIKRSINQHKNLISWIGVLHNTIAVKSNGKITSAHICQTKLKDPFEFVNSLSHWAIEYSERVCSMVQYRELSTRFIGKQCTDSFSIAHKKWMTVLFKECLAGAGNIPIELSSRDIHSLCKQIKSIWIHVVSPFLDYGIMAQKY